MSDLYAQGLGERPPAGFQFTRGPAAICSAYIKSQEHRGWSELSKVYEDAAQSGSTLDRPAMKELLADIERGRIDVVVICKPDRLSRSLQPD